MTSLAPIKTGTPIGEGLDFVPQQSTRYAIVRCSGQKTLRIANELFNNFGIHAWVPITINPRPRKGQKRVTPTLPGFVFIPTKEIDRAEKLSERRLIPAFSVLVTNGVESTCTQRELEEFNRAVNETNIDVSTFKQGLKVGDRVTITSWPLAGNSGELTSIYVEKTLMVSMTMGSTPKVVLPAAFVSSH